MRVMRVARRLADGRILQRFWASPRFGHGLHARSVFLLPSRVLQTSKPKARSQNCSHLPQPRPPSYATVEVAKTLRLTHLTGESDLSLSELQRRSSRHDYFTHHHILHHPGRHDCKYRLLVPRSSDLLDQKYLLTEGALL